MSESKFRHEYVLETIQREGWEHTNTRDGVTQFREVLRGDRRLWQIILTVATIAYVILISYMLLPVTPIERVTITQDVFEIAAKEARDNDLAMTANYYCIFGTLIQISDHIFYVYLRVIRGSFCMRICRYFP